MSVGERLAALNVDTQRATLDSLGTLAEMAAESSEIASGPFAPFLASAFCAQLRTGTWTEEHAVTFLGFVGALGQQQSYLALRESADVLLEDERALGLAGETLHDAVLPDTDSISASPLLAGLRLDIALEVVARTDVAPYRLLALLTRPVDNYPEDFDDPLARALGVAAGVWTSASERRRFAATLAELEERGSEDAAYESALEQLRDALIEENREGLLIKVRAAREKFAALSRQIERRDDAQAFAEACTAIIAFDEGDRNALSASAQAARAVADRVALLTRGLHSRHQAIARNTAELAWTSLAWRLESAATEIDEDAFLDTWVAVDAIINVYEADRQFSNLATVSSLIRPRLVNEIAQRGAMTHQLDRAVTIDKKRDKPELPIEIYDLLDLVHCARSAGRETADDSEESSHGDAYLRALLGPTAGVLGDLSAAKRTKLEDAARQSFVGSLAGDRPTNELIERLTARAIADLGENEAFVGTAKKNFSLLVLYTVRFLVFVGDNSQSYTEPIPRGGRKPLEADLQKHFHQFLCGTELAGRVGMEHANIAGGRADVITTFDGAQRFVTEVKRELRAASRESLEKAYLAQALEYQSTSEPFGQLLVLDLTDHSGGTPHINDSVWVTHSRDADGRVTASAIVAVVRGNRATPSAMQ